MLLEAAALLFDAVATSDKNEISKTQQRNQVELARIDAEQREKDRKHERNMTILNGIFNVLSSVDTTSNNSKQ